MAAEMIGEGSLAADWGRKLKLVMYADSSAAIALSKRRGAGKLRHINVSALWIQDIQDREGAQYLKIDGTKNPADLMTKYLVRDKIDACMKSISQEVRQGRATTGLDIQGA